MKRIWWRRERNTEDEIKRWRDESKIKDKNRQRMKRDERKEKKLHNKR